MIQRKREVVLIAATTWWPAPARLAMAFRQLGHRVEAICPSGHPLRHTRAVARCIDYSFLRPLAALRCAITAARPTLIVPCDDRAVQHLHALHDSDRGGELAELITTSLGQAAAFPVVGSRSSLLTIAAAEGLRVPPSLQLRSPADLEQWNEPLPWVIKCGMSWGGAGVRIVHTRAEALRAFSAVARPVSIARAVKRLVVNRDGFSLRPSLARQVPEVIVQRFIPGVPASTTMACWQGTMMAQLSVRAIGTQGPTGAATEVEVIDHPDMAKAAILLTARLRLSGFHGIDFVLDRDGAAWLIELNPRATQVCHLAINGGASLAEALLTGRSGSAAQIAPVAPHGRKIAFFPQAWRSNASAALLRSESHDVPWEEPDLVSYLMAPPWPNRGGLARLWQRLFDPKEGQDYWAGAAPVVTQTPDSHTGTADMPKGDTASDCQLPA